MANTLGRTVARVFAASALVFCASAALAAAAARPPGVQVPPLERIVLPNGITLVMMQQREVPLIAFAAVLRGGAVADPAGKAGVASMYAGLLEKGAGTRDAYAFADAVEGAGGSFGAGADTEAVTLRGQFLSRDRALMLELLSDALRRPRLDAQQFASLRERQIEFIKAAKDSNPSGLIDAYGRALLFSGHPYGSSMYGSERSLAAIRLEDVQAYYHDQVGADRLTLVFTGDIDAAWLRQAVTAAFADWPRASRAAPVLSVLAPVVGRKVLLIDSPGSVQTYFWLANVGVSRRFAQRAVLDVVNTLYGGRFTSILNTELRIRSGLTYGAGSGFTRGSVPGSFAISSFTQTDNTTKAIDLALATLDTLHRDGVAPAMVGSARSYVLGQYPTRLETAAHWAGALADLELYGLGPEYINDYGAALLRVTTQDARGLIDRVFPTSQNLVMVLIGDAARIRGAVAKYGPVTEMPLSAGDFAPQP